MRKADYAALTAIIAEMSSPDYVRSQGTPPDSIAGKAQIRTARILARRFADRASVDKAQFLKACGID